MAGGEDWKRLEAALDAVLALPQSEWEGACARYAREDAELGRELKSLLAHMGGNDALDSNAFDTLAPRINDTGSLEPGSSLGVYRILALIGRGGMGEVYRAARADGQFEQQVAIKLLRREAADEPGRFRVERQILARLEHPNIARLHDGGVSADGRPYMVLELVEGEPLIDWAQRQGCSLQQRLRLFMMVCDAVGFAHRNLVVHRDLKPSNVLVTADGTVKLLDFGVAKLLAESSSEPTRNAPITPGYAAPEQLTGGTVTTATDVYALGMLLFELLCGERPWRLKELPFAAALDKVLRDEPPVLSRFASALPKSATPPQSLRGDLDAIVAKALRKEPAQRYESVVQMREDIGRVLDHEPVSARQGARMYRLGRYLRRHRVLVAAGTLVLGAVITTLVAVSLEAHAAKLEARKADAVRDFLVNIFRQNALNNPDSSKAQMVTAKDLLDLGAARIHRELRDQPEVRDELIDTLADLYDQLENFDSVIALEQDELASLNARDGARSTPKKAQAQMELGRALVMKGRYAEGERTLKAALATMDALGDRDSPARVQTLIQIGLFAYHNKAPTDPETWQYTQQALDILDKTNSTSDDRLSAMELLARIAELRGEDADAERRYHAFISLAEAPQFRQSPVALGSAYDDLATFLQARHRSDEAESWSRRALKVLTGAEGEQQLDAAMAKSTLARIRADMGFGAEAEALLEAAVRAMEISQGADNVLSTVTMRQELARLEYGRGELPAARTHVESNIAAFEQQSANDSHYYPAALDLRAHLLAREGRLSEAERDLAHALELLQRAHAEQSDAYGAIEADLADVHRKDGNMPSALSMCTALLKSPPANKDPLGATRAGATHCLVAVDLAINQPAQPLSAAQALVKSIEASPHRAGLVLLEMPAQRSIGLALLADGYPSEAEAHLRRSLELRRAFDANSSPWTAGLALNLASALYLENKGDEAARLVTEAASVLGAKQAIAADLLDVQRLEASLVKRCGAHAAANPGTKVQLRLPDGALWAAPINCPSL